MPQGFPYCPSCGHSPCACDDIATAEAREQEALDSLERQRVAADEQADRDDEHADWLADDDASDAHGDALAYDESEWDPHSIEAMNAEAWSDLQRGYGL